MTEKNICFVTGGAGFIGSHLCEALLRDNRIVITIDNFDPFYDPAIKQRNIDSIQKMMIDEKIESSNFRLIEGDIRDFGLLEKIFSELKQYDRDITILHIAAKAGVRPSIENAPLYTDVNIIGTQNIFEVAKSFGVKKIIYASSSSVYGENKKVPFSEEDSVDNPISPYAMTKKSNELLAHTYHHLYAIDTIGLRFFTVYGPRQRPDLAINKFTGMIDSSEAIPFYGDGTTRRDYTYIDDIIDGVLKSIHYIESHDNIYEIFNLGESQTTTLRELVSLIENALGKKAKLNKLPLQPGDVSQTYADISKAKRIIGYHPTTLITEGINKFAAWHKAQEHQA
ncbi:MAG: GDP-mannose 4,6-dehydratase [Campylobacterota bacterium]|nr:GDP-mannose 4,6-dehydratase [Campylobacterota bacterium]